MKRVFCKLAGSTGVVLATWSPAIAGDMPLSLPVKAPVAYVTKAPRAPVYNWTGFYVGGHFGYGDGRGFGAGTNPLALLGVFLPHSFNWPDSRLPDRIQSRIGEPFSCLASRRIRSFTSPTDAPRAGAGAVQHDPRPRRHVARAVSDTRSEGGCPMRPAAFAWGHTPRQHQSGPAEYQQHHLLGRPLPDRLDRGSRAGICREWKLEREAGI